MNRRSTVFLLLAAVAVLVLAAVFLPLGKSSGKPVGSRLFDFDADDISQIKITNGDDVFELRRTEDGWMTGPDPKDRASVEAVRRLIETARSTPILDRIEAGELNDRDQLSTYGLKKSRVQFDFRGDRDLPLLIGKDSVDESRAYVRFEDSKDVYLIPDALVNLILSSPQDFRDRMPLRLRPDRVDGIVIKHPSGEIELKREAGGWQIIKPLSARASDRAIAEFLDKLLRIRIEAFEPSADPAMMGLSEPAAEVQLFDEGDPVPETIRVGTPSPQGGVFAELQPRGVTVQLPAAVLGILALDMDTLRDKSLARINLDLVDMIRVTTPSASFSLKRNGDGWVVGNKKASAAAVQRMVDALALSQSQGFKPATVDVLETAGFSNPPLAVEFFSVVSENTPETNAGSQLVAGVKFGTTQADGLVPAWNSGAPEMALVSDKILEAIPTQESAWQAP